MIGRRLVDFALGAILIVTGCGEQSPSSSSAAPTTQHTDRLQAFAPAAAPGLAKRPRRVGEVEYYRYADEPMKPAHRFLGILPAQKADAADNVRHAAPDRYAITEPPPAGIRPMVEWEPMQALVLSVPSYMTGNDYLNSRNTIVKIAKHSATVAEVWILMDTPQGQDAMTQLLLDDGVSQSTIDTKIKFIIENNDTVWLIDYGPFPIVDDSTDTFAFADFRYFHDRAVDDGLPTFIGRSIGELGQASDIATYRMPLNTEGGTIQATSDGTCFTSDGQLFWMSYDAGSPDQSIMSSSLEELQNHPYAQEVKSVLSTYAGCQDLIITHSVSDDGTLHIDMYMKVIDDNTVLMGEYVAPFESGTGAEANAARMDANAAFLESYVKTDGTSFEVKRLIMPGHRTTQEGPMPFTYANSTLINGLNLWPAYTWSEWEESRDLAETQWEAALPDYEHIWIDSEELSFWSGAIHCITRTIPDKAPGLWVADGGCTDDTCQPPEGGYSGDCTPNDISYEVCYGPEWLCTCNDCDTACDYDPSTAPPDSCAVVDCGSYSPDNGLACSCDDLCVQYEDCCDDSCDVCGVGPDCEGGGPDPDPEGCGDITYEGCCDGETLTWCENGGLETIDCEAVGNPKCGWATGDGFYNCATDGSPDPSGAFPMSCEGGGSACTPECSGKACGDDGCGGGCGTCGTGSLCTNDGQCVEVCQADCTGKTCGDNGCGGSCGTCGGDAPFCVDGGCVGSCTADCSGKVCGDDGCGGTCGSCGADQACESGQCIACVAACDAKTCGDDGCGGTCGTCVAGETCTAGGQCVVLCTADCSGKTCGGDGCGGSCGNCAPGQSCTDAGQCLANCAPSCDGKACGDDGCGGSCGTCAADENCSAAGQCEGECLPVCDGTFCGDNGCGGACGVCSPGETCVEGVCEADSDPGTSSDTSGSSTVDAAGSGDSGGVGPDTIDPNTGTGNTGGNGSVGGDGSGGGSAASGCAGGQSGPGLPLALSVLLGLGAILRRRVSLN